jgi:hypothetical protein
MVINSSTYGDSIDMNINNLRRLTVIGCNLNENVYFRTASHDILMSVKQSSVFAQFCCKCRRCSRLMASKKDYTGKNLTVYTEL